MFQESILSGYHIFFVRYIDPRVLVQLLSRKFLLFLWFSKASVTEYPNYLSVI